MALLRVDSLFNSRFEARQNTTSIKLIRNQNQKIDRKYFDQTKIPRNYFLHIVKSRYSTEVMAQQRESPQDQRIHRRLGGKFFWEINSILGKSMKLLTLSLTVSPVGLCRVCKWVNGLDGPNVWNICFYPDFVFFVAIDEFLNTVKLWKTWNNADQNRMKV